MAATPPESLRLETDVPAQVRVGEGVPITLRATNAGPKPLELYLMGRSPTFDVVITGANGAVIWRRLEGQTVQAILQIRTLAPGETLELRHDWNQRSTRGQPVGPGTYVVQGRLITDAQPLRTPAAPLRIVARTR
jgi:intracellular proteinase inhibitor BsuPI